MKKLFLCALFLFSINTFAQTAATVEIEGHRGARGWHLENMKKFDLDGIISDYPDRAIKIFRKTKQ